MSLLLGLTGILSQFLIFRYVLIRKLRLKASHFKIIYSTIKKEKKGVVFSEEFNYDINGKLPSVFSGIFKTKGLPLFYINMDERVNQAGWESTTSICEIIIPRWGFKKLSNFICERVFNESDIIDVFINDRWIGELETDKSLDLDSQYKEIEDDFKLIDEGKMRKTSALLYGPPGNGKTTLVRDLAKKYNWNIKYLDISSSMTNEDLLALPSSVPDKTIILMEDFDSVFNKRENIKYKNNVDIKFSFDAILNMLDGVFVGKNKVAFIMTVNDIFKVDGAISERRSRMKHKLRVNNPSYSKVISIVGDKELADIIYGANLDNVYSMLEFYTQYGKERTLEKYLNKTNLIETNEK